MRLIYHSDNPDDARRLFEFLIAQKIDAEFEPGEKEARIWVVDEDQWDQAHEWATAYRKDARDPIFDAYHSVITVSQKPEKAIHRTTIRPQTQKRMGPLSSIILFLCVFFYVITTLQRIDGGEKPGLFTPLEENMLYDFPRKTEIGHTLLRQHTPEEINHPQSLPPETIGLIREWNQQAEWEGVYDLSLDYVHDRPMPATPLFEKISQGELWRLITPCFLHGGLIHIFFNMLWLIMLSPQLETRMGRLNFIGFVLVTGVFSNTLQYLMGGARFVGYSGVILAMLAYVATRRKRAPWEGYSLPAGAVRFVGGFVLIFAGLQGVAYIAELFSGETVGLPIANTAHLSGAFIGWLLARLK